jgi:glucose/arabinose dehydrogenase
MRHPLLFSVLLALTPAAGAFAQAPADVRLARFPDDATTFKEPIAIRAPNDGSGRVFVVERCGTIRVVKDGKVLAEPFLQVKTPCDNEYGLLGLAFHPDYARNGRFFVTHTAPGGGLGELEDQWLVGYEASPPSADVAKAKGDLVLRVPGFARNHVGGDIAFGPDGYLIWSMGDSGEDGQDPGQGLSQCTKRKRKDMNPASCGEGPRRGRDVYYLRGKIIRIDIDHETAKAPSNMCGATTGRQSPYSLPAGNPFADTSKFPDDCGEILHWGLRNPFRATFDRETGALLIADVGHGRYEELDYAPAGSAGLNFQWPVCEGIHTLADDKAPCEGPAGSVPPRVVTPRGAIIGGYIYRGPVVSLRGHYVFGDYVQGKIYIAANPTESGRLWRYEEMPGVKMPGVYGFGEDDEGHLYVASGMTGEVYRFAGDP